MGQTLSEPVTAKETASCSNNNLKVGSSCMQGWRINMEDAHTHLLSVPEDKDLAYFAVYDGHGGAKVAHYAGNHLHRRILNTESFNQGKIESAIREGFLLLDEDMINDQDLKDELAGTTAITVLLKNNKLFCGNVGDSRAVVSVNGLADPMSYDHKPANEDEARRIVAAGGWVEFNRVNGNLALSRALGDFIFKRNDEKCAEEQIVTAYPDVIVKDVSDDMEFFVLACDGIWDVLSNQDVIDFCRDRLAAKIEPELVCEELLTRCLAPDCQMGGLGCDNMTVILVCMTRGLSWDEYCAQCARPRPPTPPPEESPPPVFSTPPATPKAAPSAPVHVPTAGAKDPDDPFPDASAPVPGGTPPLGDSPPQRVPEAPPVPADSSSSDESSRSPAPKATRTADDDESAPMDFTADADAAAVPVGAGPVPAGAGPTSPTDSAPSSMVTPPEAAEITASTPGAEGGGDTPPVAVE